MDRQTVIDTLRRHEQALRAEGISQLFLFGSVARGEADEKSDVDLFYDYELGRLSLFDVMRIQEQLSELLDVKVDSTTRRGLHPLIRTKVEREAVQIF